MRKYFPVIAFFFSALLLRAGALVSHVEVKTGAPNNPTVTFYYRVPESYDASSQTQYRVLIYFGGRNCSGEKEAAGILGFDKWADEQSIFIVAPGYKDDDYWYPGKWSGRALVEALAQIKKQYRINDVKLLYYGYSGGSQCSNLFASWRPDIVRAWVAHACGVFHNPSIKMRNIPALVTCGEADPERYMLSRKFVTDYRKQKINIIWKSFPNAGHEVSDLSAKLAQAFLAYYHKLYLRDLNNRAEMQVQITFPFVGDDQDGIFYPIDSPKVHFIADEDKVYLPSEDLAKAWGKPVKSIQYTEATVGTHHSE